MMKAVETQWSICTDTEQKQEKNPCKGEAVWRRQGGRKRVEEGKKHLEDVGCEDVTQTLLHRRSYAETRVHTDAFTHRNFYTHTQTHTHTHTL